MSVNDGKAMDLDHDGLAATSQTLTQVWLAAAASAVAPGQKAGRKWELDRSGIPLGAKDWLNG